MNTSKRTVEVTYSDEEWAKEARRDYIDRLHREVSLIAYDPERELYVFDVYADEPEAEPAAPAGPKFPDVTVQLTGEDGNAFFIAARVRQALTRAGHREGAEEFFGEALSGDYDHLLQTALAYVNCE